MNDRRGGRPHKPASGAGRALRWLDERPRVALTVKTAVAASLAWTVAQLIPGPASEYPFYAPLGAVVTSSITVAGSARESARVLLAIIVGAAVGVALALLAAPNLVSIGLAIGAGTALAGWRPLRDASSWVPTSALFVMIFGSDDPAGYVFAYAGLVLLGSLIGLAVTVAFPPLPLAPAQLAVDRVRETLTEQLEALAEGLQREHPPSRHEWRDRTRQIDPVLAQMRSAVQEADEARRGNRRLRGHQQEAERLYAQARALESLAFLVEDLTQLIADTEVADRQRVALGPYLRPPTAAAIAQLAEVLRTIEGSTAEADAARRGYEALHRLAQELRQARRQTDDDLFTASSVVEGIRRCLAAVVPQDLAEEENAGDPVEEPG